MRRKTAFPLEIIVTNRTQLPPTFGASMPILTFAFGNRNDKSAKSLRSNMEMKWDTRLKFVLVCYLASWRNRISLF